MAAKMARMGFLMGFSRKGGNLGRGRLADFKDGAQFIQIFLILKNGDIDITGERRRAVQNTGLTAHQQCFQGGFENH
jgi:hypothetical protein